MKIKLSNLGKATTQQVFEHIATHLLKQNAQSIAGGECLYHHGGLMCAAGCLMSGPEYNKLNKKQFNYNGIDYHGIENITWSDLVTMKLVPDNHGELIIELQDVHDRGHVDQWKTELKGVANDYGLDATFLERL